MKPALMELVVCWWIPRFAVGETRSGIMAGWRQAVELATTSEEIARLTAVSRSRTELASRVSRAQMLLAYCEHPLFCAVGQRLGVHHQTVQRWSPCWRASICSPRQGPCARQTPPSQSGVRRIPQTSRCRLPDIIPRTSRKKPKPGCAHRVIAWLATRPAGRFEFTFTRTHGSWLNLIEGFFSLSSLARSSTTSG